MTKQHFIALADMIREHNRIIHADATAFTPDQIDDLARFCARQNPQFNRERWLGYVAGTNGSNGGSRTPKGGK